MTTFDDVHDRALTLPDGRVLGWTEFGPSDGIAVLRVPGTPGSRWTIRADRAPWRERNLRVITTERPGFGRSTRLPGRGFVEHADDVARLLDHLDLPKVHIYGASGGAPHILAFAAQHGERLHSASIIAGAAPVTRSEVEKVIPINQQGHRLAAAGNLAGIVELLTPIAAALAADPMAGFLQQMSSAPPDDHAVMSDPQWQAVFERAIREAMAQGPAGWADEAMAILGGWADIELGSVATSVTWYHTRDDRNAPFSAAARLVDRLPNGRFVVWPEGGHLASYHREAEVLDELLGR